MYTWKHRQPSSVIGDPNRVTRQACILARILESYIRQVEHLDLFVRSVHTCRLRETAGEEEDAGDDGREIQERMEESGGKKEEKKQIRPKIPRREKEMFNVVFPIYALQKW